MSKDEIIRCMQDALDKKLTPTNEETDLDAFVEAMNEQGYDFTVQDVKEMDEFIAKRSLGEDELESVAGGVNVRNVFLLSLGTAISTTNYIINRAMGMDTTTDERKIQLFSKELLKELNS